jgi:hypothetical protein
MQSHSGTDRGSIERIRMMGGSVHYRTPRPASLAILSRWERHRGLRHDELNHLLDFLGAARPREGKFSWASQASK